MNVVATHNKREMEKKKKILCHCYSIKACTLKYECSFIMFYTPTTIGVIGSTCSGKSTWVYKLLENKESLFDIVPNRVLYCYSMWQPLFDKMARTMPFIEFHEGLASSEKIQNFGGGQHNLLVYDDLMERIGNNIEAQEVFTKKSHHLNITAIYINQNLFAAGKCMRTIALNTHYIVLMNTMRRAQIATLGQQLLMGKSLLESYTDAMNSSGYGYLLVALSPRHKSPLKLFTQIFHDESPLITYVPIK